MRKAAIIAGLISVIAAGPAFPAFVAAENLGRQIPLAKDSGRQLSLEEMGEVFGGNSGFEPVATAGNDIIGDASNNSGNIGVNSAQGDNNTGNIGVGSNQCQTAGPDSCVGAGANVGINSNLVNGNALMGASAMVMMMGVNSTANVQINMVVIKNGSVTGNIHGSNSINP